MLGAIIGDIIGSIYEFNNVKRKDFPLFCAQSRFTDDTVMTVATIDALINDIPFAKSYKKWYRRYPDAGYGNSFKIWAESEDDQPYFSWGNGSAMRVSPIAWYYNDLDSVLKYAKDSAAVTHNHPEGIKGAQATAAAVFLARRGKSKEQIREFIANEFGYDLSEPLNRIRERYSFDVSCQGSVPQAIIAFLESEDFEDAIRNAVSVGGDSDTIACITGAIAEGYYGSIPQPIVAEALSRLDRHVLELLVSMYHRIRVLK